MSVATLRSSIAAAIANPEVWQVFSYPPASPLANSIVISPDDPYLEPTNNTWNINFTANFKLTLMVPLFDNQGNLNNIETYMTALFLKLSASTLSFRINNFSAPSVLPVDEGQMLACDISISILSSWS